MARSVQIKPRAAREIEWAGSSPDAELACDLLSRKNDPAKIGLMTFTWDVRKAQENLRKHRVSFDGATTVFWGLALDHHSRS